MPVCTVRVFVTLKPSVFDPQGRTIAEALHSLGYGGVARRPAGQVLRARHRRPADATRRRHAGPRSRGQAARQSGHRELPHRGRRSREGHAMKFAVVVFPGSNCDHDAYHAAKHVLGQQAEFVWHKDTILHGADVVILPGGFAHGDYLRTGAIARFSPIMAGGRGVRRARRPGARHLQRLPGSARGGPAAGRDAAQPQRCKFRCEHVARARRADRHAVHARLHAPGRCCGCRSRTARATTSPSRTCSTALETNRQVIFRYATPHGRDRPTTPNPNGSLNNIAGICNERRNVVGLMPHPERACEPALGSADGLVLFESVLQQALVAARRRCHDCARHDAPIDDPPSSTRHGLKRRRIRTASSRSLGREPNLTELGIFSVMWSEHCSYKSSRVHLKTLPTEGPRVLQGPGENAGAVDIGDGLAAVFKIESHNHPSFIEPYQGAATGVGGIIRDIFTMGARPIALLELAALRPTRRSRGTRRIVDRRRRRHRRLRQQHRHPDGRRRGRVRRVLRRQSAGQRVLPRHRRGTTSIFKGTRRGRRQSRLLRRREDGPRRHPRRDDGVGGVRRRSRPRSGRPCRSAIRSWRSCCSRPASR